MMAVIYTGITIHLIQVNYTVYEVKIKALASVAKSEPILLATWEFF